MVVLTVSQESLESALGVWGSHQKQVSRLGFLKELFLKKSVCQSIYFVTIFSQFYLWGVYKRLYDLMNLTHPLLSNRKRWTPERVFGIFFSVYEVESESSIVSGLDETVDLPKIDATHKLGASFICEAQKFLRRKYAEACLSWSKGTVHGFRKESLLFSRVPARMTSCSLLSYLSEKPAESISLNCSSVLASLSELSSS